MHTLTIYYFGDLMGKLGLGRETLRLSPSHATIAGLMNILAIRGGEWDKAFSQSATATPRNTLQILVNKRAAQPDTVLASGDEVAFIESIPL